MRKVILLFTLAFALTIQLQAQRPWKEYLIPGSLIFVSGMVEGTTETLVFHYKYGFKKVFPDASDQFWDPSISWRNKYKNGQPSQGELFPGSKDFLVAFTDGYHLTRMTKLMLDMGAVTYCANKNHPDVTRGKKVNWKTVAQDFVVLSAIRTLGFHVTYSWIFKMPDPDQVR